MDKCMEFRQGGLRERGYRCFGDCLQGVLTFACILRCQYQVTKLGVEGKQSNCMLCWCIERQKCSYWVDETRLESTSEGRIQRVSRIRRYRGSDSNNSEVWMRCNEDLALI